MICQGCGNNSAVVHLEELRQGKRIHLWLCMECAGKRKSKDDGLESDDFDLPDWDNLEFRPDSNFSPFFGQGIDGEHGLGAVAQKCPACGFSLDKLGRTNRLGCPSCYEFFRVALKPVLERLHRHSSHFGKVPWKNGGELKLESEIARHRAALEKAVVSENFEEAARLRDLITRLESGDEEPTEGADEQEER